MKTTRARLLFFRKASPTDTLCAHRRAASKSLRRQFCRALATVSAVGAFALAGCKKAETSAPPPGSIQVAGVKLDLPKLDTEFQNADPEIQAAVQEIKKSYRGGRLEKMATDLDALSKNPSLTESQKKLVGDLIQQVLQLLGKIPPPPG